MIRAALLGAILVHPVLFLAAFLSGVVFGAKDSWNADRAPTFGWQGGLDGMTNMLLLYLITMGLAPLVVSMAGAILGATVCSLFRMFARKGESSTDKNRQAQGSGDPG